MKLSSAKKRFSGEWLAFQFSKGDEGRVLSHEKERSRLFEKLRARRRLSSGLYVTFAGPVLPKDVGIVLILKP